MKTKHKVLSGMLAVVVSISTLSSVAKAGIPKVSTDETVYANLDYYGKPNQVTIVKGCSLNGNAKFTDYGLYDKVTNMTNESKPTIKGDLISWNLDQNTGRFYYECTPKSGTVAMPWSFDVSYKLNGVPADAKKLAGASGLVEINIKAIPSKSVSAYYKNNMLLQVGTTVNMKDNLSVEAPGSQIQSLGNYKTVLFAGLPGEEKTFTIRIGTKSFESTGIVIMMVPGTLDKLEDIKELKESKDTVKNSLDLINQSTNEMLGTLEGMSIGIKQTQSGLSSLDDARNSISSSKGNIYIDNDKALADLSSTVAQTTALVPHLQEGQDVIEEVNARVNMMVGTITNLSSNLTSLSTSIKKVRGDVNDLRNVLDKIDAKSGERDDIMRSLENNLETAQSKMIELQSQMSQLSTQTNRASNNIGDLITKLTYISKSTLVDASTSQMIQLTIPSLQNLKSVMKVMGSIGSTASETDDFLDTGKETLSLIDTYFTILDEGHDTTDKLLKNMNSIASSTDGVLSSSQDVINSIIGLNDTMNKYKSGAVETLEDTKKLTNGLASGLTSAHTLMSSLETLMKNSGNNLDEGTRKSLSGLINVMEKSLDGIGKTSTFKDANNEIKRTVDNQIDKYQSDNNLLNLDAKAKAISFTSSKNDAPDSIQVILRTKEISIDDNKANIKDLEKEDEEVGVLTRIQNVFIKIKKAIISAFTE